MTEPEEDQKPLTLLQLIGSALAAAFGVQTSRNRERDFSRGKPSQFIIIGVVFTALFVLAVAGVEGEEFTAQIVARVQKLEERQALEALSRDLAARHRLVQELGFRSNGCRNSAGPADFELTLPHLAIAAGTMDLQYDLTSDGEVDFRPHAMAEVGRRQQPVLTPNLYWR